MKQQMVYKHELQVKKTNLEAKFTKSSEKLSKLKGKTQNFEKNLKNSSKKLKVSANPLGLLAENASKKKAALKTSRFFSLLGKGLSGLHREIPVPCLPGATA